MAYHCLQDFLATLEKTGQLHRIPVEVDPVLEIAEITERICKSPGGGKALLFENVKGSPFPVATNLFGSYGRVCQALEVNDFAELSRCMKELLDTDPESTAPQESWVSQHLLAPFEPIYTARGLCQEETTLNLSSIPILKSWPEDGGKFITLPLVFTVDAETGSQNCGMYRTRVFDGKKVGINWSPGSGGFLHAIKYRERNEAMPVAIVVGCDPAIIWSATLPLPPAVDEMSFAGYLRKEPVSMVRCQTTPILVPANAEMVIEGFIEPSQMLEEGAFGNHTGYYTNAGKVPVVTVSRITHRTNMIYPATVVGQPPMEDCYLAKAAERLLLPFTRRQVPAIVDINLPVEGIFHGCAIVSLDKNSSGHPGEVMEQIWSTGWLQKAKLLVMVDADIAVNDLSMVAWKVLNNAEWSRDVVIRNGKLGLDATEKDCASKMKRRPLLKDPAVVRQVDKKWRQYGWE